jgi:hypothetical protein
MLLVISVPATCRAWARLGLCLLGFGLILAGCSRDAPRAGSADIAASRKAALGRGDGSQDFGTRKVGTPPARTRGKRAIGPAPKSRGNPR